ncbi:hypothetical protein [Massilia luteola]|uniref:hypothetical protein n=1 Tax=Massilia luteola TaxID=3081751 RepID=UPI002ACC0415|nr:hypothetical protein [Massilia sp. Gc5]
MRSLPAILLLIGTMTCRMAEAQAQSCSPVGTWTDDYGYTYQINPQLTGSVAVVGCGGLWSLSVSGTNPFTATATNPAPSGTCAASFTMVMTFSATSCDSASGTWTNSAGYSGTDTWTRRTGLKILAPVSAATYQIATPVPFDATGADNVPIDWNLALAYTTSGGRGPFTNASTLTTSSGVTQTRTFDAMGGQLTATATQNSSSDRTVVTITGITISADDITNRLVGLYAGGSTPHLLTGIAQRESSYVQFSQLTLYGQSALWPRESFDGGSHIGLMQMPVSMQMAWDWMANTQGGAALFKQKLTFATRFETRIRNAHPGLPALTGTQSENMALVFYGPYATGSITGQYYDATCVGGTGPQCTGGQWQWIVNTAGNGSGVGYADSIRSLMH